MLQIDRFIHGFHNANMSNLRIKLMLFIFGLLCGLHCIAFTPFVPHKSIKSCCHRRVIWMSDKSIQNAPTINSNVSIKYCVGCKWGLRSSWLQQELLSTFNDGNLGSVSLIPCRPPEPSGIFIVKVDDQIIWDRKVDGGFPEAKVLKQKVRDIIQPSKDLGHSDVSDRSSTNILSTQTTGTVCLECEDAEKRSLIKSSNVSAIAQIDENNDRQKFDVKIEFCTGCKWMLRANYLQMELLSTFQDQITSITLIPSRPPAPGGIFKITLNDDMIWDRTLDGGFPETKILKQRVRDIIDPKRDLGHSDTHKDADIVEMSSLSDEESEQMRGYFGVM